MHAKSKQKPTLEHTAAAMLPPLRKKNSVHGAIMLPNARKCDEKLRWNFVQTTEDKKTFACNTQSKTRRLGIPASSSAASR
jgi:hypothetical protein